MFKLLTLFFADELRVRRHRGGRSSPCLYRELAVHSLVAIGRSQQPRVDARCSRTRCRPQLEPYLATADTMPTERLQSHPDREKFAALWRAHCAGSPVVKVKVYDLGGRTVFSTEPSQIGEDKSSNPGFRRRDAGTSPASSRIATNSAHSIGSIENADILSTYIPVRLAADGAVGASSRSTTTSRRSSRESSACSGWWRWPSSSLLCVLLRRAVRDRRSRRRRDTPPVPASASSPSGRCAAPSARSSGASRSARKELARANAGLEAEVAERRLADQRVVHMAHHDALTGLPNRTLFADRVGQAIARAHRSGGKLAVLFLDLDRFKNVNDSLGHAIGDLLLTGGRRAPHDVPARRGHRRAAGRRRVHRQPPRHRRRRRSRARGRPHPRRARQAVHDRRVTSCTPTCSIGIALYPRDGDTAETLMRNADTAMYHAKESGRGNYQFFSAQMTERVSRRLSTETDLRRALERGEFTLHYQPLVDSCPAGASAAPRRCCAGRSRTIG